MQFVMLDRLSTVKTVKAIILSKLLIIGIFIISCLPAVAARQVGDDKIVDDHQFAIDRSEVTVTARLRDFAEKINSAYHGDSLIRVSVIGAESPDGPLQHNQQLARNRAAAVRQYLMESTSVPGSYFTIISKGEDWEGFSALLPDNLTEQETATVRNILTRFQDPDARERQLKSADNGRIWEKLVAGILPKLRRVVLEAEMTGNRKVTLVVNNDEQLPEPEPVVVEEVIIEEEEIFTPEPEPQIVEVAELVPYHWYLKTNLPAWALLIVNLQAEMDVVEHMSVMLPIYYSGWNYMKETLKFHTFTVLPEIRWWPRNDNQGFFIGAHGGFSYYNIALDKEKRYQDHDGTTPAVGGGLTLGYRLPIRKSSPWQFEFSAGYGIYRLDYDTFRNVHNGLLTGRVKRTFYGIDNVAVTLSYRFDQKRTRTQIKQIAK